MPRQREEFKPKSNIRCSHGDRPGFLRLNKIGGLINSEKTSWILAVFFSCIAIQLYACFATLYHNLFTPPEQTITSSLLVALTMLLLPIGAAALFRSPLAVRTTSICLLIYCIYKIAAIYFPAILKLPLGAKLVLLTLTLALAFLLSRYLSEKILSIVSQISFRGALFFLISFLLVAFFQKPSPTDVHSTFNIKNTLPKPPRATVFLLLDELSPEETKPIISVLSSPSHSLFVGKALKAGKDTVNAIPSILTHQRHDSVVPCGPMQLCGSVPFYPANLKSSRSDTDVIGSWHPYCAIHDLRYCKRFTSTDLIKDPSFSALLKNSISLLPLVGHFFPNHTLDDIYQRLRKLTEDQTMSAPFWTEGGGLLYVHDLLPHPTGMGPARRLASEYQQNILNASEFVHRILEKLQAQFGADYALIITSDHPLRSFWCNNPTYSSDCLTSSPTTEGNDVPFIVLAPRGEKVIIPQTMVGVLAE